MPSDSVDEGHTENTVPDVSDPDAAGEENQSESYVPELEPLDMEVMLNSHTDLYYFHAEEGEKVPANSAEITDWKKVEEETTLVSTDLVKMYLAYTIPAGSLNETNSTARYRLPGNIHLTDDQIKAINENENGITAGFKKLDPEYQKYLGAEAIEGDRTPDELLSDSAQEYISAIVRAENVYKNDKYIGQDLIFTFVPYTIEKNQENFDAEKNPVSAGEKITGWFACDFRQDQIDWIEEELQEETQEEIRDETQGEIQEQAQDNMQEETPEETDQSADDPAVVTVEKTAEILFVTENKDQEIEEIKRTLKLIGQKEDAVSEEEVSKEETKEETQEFQSGTLTADGEGYKITLDYTEEAKIPENASLSVREITAETDKEAYEACLEQAGQQVAADNNTSVDQKASRFFDIEIVVTETDNNGEEKTVKIEPSAPVSVNIQIEEKQPSSQESKSDQSEPTILHFAEEGVEQIDSTVTDSENNNTEEQKKEIQFEAESFSVYGVVYTVDFHWEVNGKIYEFSIPGGGFVSIEHLVEVLGIASDDENTEKGAENAENDAENSNDFVGEVPGVEENGENGTAYEEAINLNEVEVSEATKKFVADVESVEFSSSELVWVGKVNEESTVGGLKETNGLEVQYSAELAEEQIAEIDGQTIQAGDWALISLKAFDTEENLTVTMKNEDQWTVKVTDAQVTGQLTDGQKYLIYYTSNGKNYVLKKDGTVTPVDASNPNNMDKLGDEYLWQFDHYNRFGDDYSLIHSGSTYLTLNGTVTGIASNIATPTYMDAVGNGNFRLYGREWVQTGYWWWEGYNKNHYLTFDNNSFVLADNTGNNTNIKLWEQEERKYNFTVKTEYSNVYRGTVSGKGADGTTQYTKVPSYVSITNKGKANAYTITAVPSQGYHFKEWRLGETVLSGFNSVIQAGSLTFPEDNMILTAVFEKDAGSSGAGETDYAAIINKWKEQNLVSEMNLDKTAHVYDYDNRIYEVDFTASGKATVIAPDLQLAFVTDVSRSMYFPAGLTQAKTYSTTTYNSEKPSKPLVDVLGDLKNQDYATSHSGDHDDVYYLIGDPEYTSTVYAVRYNLSTNKWMYIDASYDIRTYPKNGASQGSDVWHVNNADGNEVGWKVLSDWVTYNNGLKLQGKSLDGKIYVANDVRYRLDYLQQAVDAASEVVYAVNQDAEIGLVTFAGTANDPHGLFGKDSYGELLTYLHDISPAGGTNQKGGLDKAQEFWSTSTDPDHNRVVIMVTDGAPNATIKVNGNDVTLNWNHIKASAEALHDNKDATVYTVGLSIENVNGAEAGLRNAAQAGGGQSYSAKNSEELVKDILNIVKLYMKEANLKGTLHDDIDSAFYPVKEDGTPITPGFYDVDGTPITLETVQSYNDVNSQYYGTEYYLWKNNGGQWSITRYNIEFGKGTSSSPATQRNIYLKAREDFMGGNKINTNVQEAHAIGSNAVIRNGSKTVVKPMDKVVDDMADTPHVNVDELHLTEHNTEWTVYLGTEVTPKDQLEALWNNIKVKQVIKEPQQTGSQDPVDVTRMIDKAQMWYAHGNAVNEADTAAPANSDNDEKLPLSYYGLNDYYDDLLAAITSDNSYDSGNIAYTPYGHDTVGYFRISATKEIVSGAVDAGGKAPDQHVTDKAASPAEIYKIIVTYTPVTQGSEETYPHTTPNKTAGNITTGAGNDEVKSENQHVINVIKKGLEISKFDENDTLINDRPAVFTLYRPAQSGETGTTVEGLGDGYIEAATMTTSSGVASLSDTVQELRKLPEGQHYYLVETQEPAGYVKLSSPIQIDISVTPGTKTKPYKQTEDIDDLINVGETTPPTAAISVTSDSAQLLTDSNGRFAIKITNVAASVDIIIHKVNDENEPLPGAVFKLTNGSSIVSIASEGNGVIVEPKESGQAVTIVNDTFTIPEGGVTIKNLRPSEDIYSIVEVSPPAGYVISNNTPATFKVTAGSIGNVEYIKGVTYTPADNDFIIPNTPGAALPNTGGPGTTPFYILGIILTAFAGAGLVMRKRKRDAA